MKKQESRLIVYPTKKPHTFFLKYKIVSPSKPFAQEHQNYKKLAQEFVNEVNEMGIKANLKQRYKYSPNFYITFRSKYDAAAFKLGWM